MKVRIGVGVGATRSIAELAQVVDGIDAAGLDSLWLSEVLSAPVLDPVVALAWAAAHHPTIKLGTTMLLPGRHPIRVAKQLSTLDVLSSGRLLVTFVPGLTRSPEREAIGVEPPARGASIDELLPLVRQLWSGEPVTHDGPAGHFQGVTLAPRPIQDPLEAWLGGMAKSALERCGRLGDGWLPSLCTPESAAAGRLVIDAVASAAERRIDPEHFGVSIGYAHEPLTDTARQAISGRSRGADPGRVVPVGVPALRRLIADFVEVGFSKFVVRPIVAPTDWGRELDALADGIADLQT